jgi:two-component system NtrC family sensor kinase
MIANPVQVSWRNPHERFYVLAVDDEPAILNCLRRELKKEPYQLITATSGPEGLELLAQCQRQQALPAVVVSDYRMPGMDGVTFLEEVKARYPEIQRVLLTAYASPQVLEDAINRCEIYRFLQKPWEHTMLCSMLRASTHQYALLLQNRQLIRERDLQNVRLRELNNDLERLIEERTWQLARAKDEISTTFDAIGAPVMLIQNNYEVLRANAAMAQHANMAPGELPGRRCHTLLRGSDAPCEGCPLPRARHSGEVATGRLHLPRRQMIFEAAVYPVPGSGELSHFVCLYHDVSEEERQRNKLVQVQKMAALGQLSGSVAHEINNPLGGILAFAQIMKREVSPESEQHTFLQHIEEAAVRCRDIVKKLLSYARSAPSEERHLTSLGVVVEKALDLNRHMLGLSNVEVMWEDEGDAALAPVRVNTFDLQGVYINLIQNAHDAMEERGGGTLRFHFRIDGEISPPVVVSRVSDTGAGIKAANLSRVFDPFFTTKEVGRGTGLGLSLAFQTVHSNQGTIEVESVEGQGTTFTLAFPLVSVGEPPAR